jgi:hypothetical protein
MKHPPFGIRLPQILQKWASKEKYGQHASSSILVLKIGHTPFLSALKAQLPHFRLIIPP